MKKKNFSAFIAKLKTRVDLHCQPQSSRWRLELTFIVYLKVSSSESSHCNKPKSQTQSHNHHRHHALAPIVMPLRSHRNSSLYLTSPMSLRTHRETEIAFSTSHWYKLLSSLALLAYELGIALASPSYLGFVCLLQHRWSLVF